MQDIFNQFDKKDVILGFVLITLLGVFGAISGAVVVSQHLPPQQANDTVSKHTQLQEKSFNPNTPNVDFQKAVDAYRQNPSSDNLQALTDAAKLRKSILKLQMQDNPAEFLANVLPKSERDSLPKEVQQYLEQDTSLTGTISFIHHDFYNYRHSEQYFVSDAEKKTYTLHFPSIHIPQPRSTLNLTGIALDSDMAVTDMTAASAGQSSANPHSVSIILVKITDGKDFMPDKSLADIKSLVTGNGVNGDLSVANYYKSVSHGSVNLSFSINDYVTLNIKDPTILSTIPSPCDNQYTLSDSIDLQASKSSMHLDSSSTRIYYMVLEPGLQCNGYGGDNTVVAIDGSKSYDQIWISDYFLADAIIHEIGHTLGVQHASYLECDNANDYTNNCEYSLDSSDADDIPIENEQYADGYSEMGGWVSSSVNHLMQSFNGPQQIELGIVGSQQIQEVTQTNVQNSPYTLNALENQSGLVLLKIPKPDMSGWAYYVEYRNGEGLDANKGVPDSIIIHLWNDANRGDSAAPIYTYHTLRVNPVLTSSGQSFSDSVNKIKITKLSSNGSSAQVQIDFVDGSITSTPSPSTSPTENSPTTTIFPTSTTTSTTITPTPQYTCTSNAILQSCIANTTSCALKAVGTCASGEQCCSLLKP